MRNSGLSQKTEDIQVLTCKRVFLQADKTLSFPNTKYLDYSDQKYDEKDIKGKSYT
jgi:hypothetical protein